MFYCARVLIYYDVISMFATVKRYHAELCFLVPLYTLKYWLILTKLGSIMVFSVVDKVCTNIIKEAYVQTKYFYDDKMLKIPI